MGLYKSITSGPGTLTLDEELQKYTSAPAQWLSKEWWSRKRRRARSYSRAMSGLHLPGMYILVTLTTGPESDGVPIQQSWKALLQQLRRWGHFKGSFRVTEHTRAGRPHIHAILRVDRYLSPGLLSSWWARIHGSPVVNITKVRSSRGMAGYLAKYLGKDVLSRYGWTADWVYGGWVGDWRLIWRMGLGRNLTGQEIVKAWHIHLDGWRDVMVKLQKHLRYWPWVAWPGT